MSTQDFLAKSAFDNLANSIEQALSDTEGFRDEAENFADLARRGIRLVGVVADLSSFPANPEDGDAVFVESETQIYFWDATSSTWKNSQIVGSAIWGNVQGTLSDQTDLQTALDGKVDNEGTYITTGVLSPREDVSNTSSTSLVIVAGLGGVISTYNKPQGATLYGLFHARLGNSNSGETTTLIPTVRGESSGTTDIPELTLEKTGATGTEDTGWVEITSLSDNQSWGGRYVRCQVTGGTSTMTSDGLGLIFAWKLG